MDEKTSREKTRRIAKIIHITFIALVIILAILLYTVMSDDTDPLFSQDGPNWGLIQLLSVLVAFINLAVGYFMPRWFLKMERMYKSGPITFQLWRLSLILSVAIIGLGTNISIFEKQISLIFIIIAGLVMLLSFPTESNFQKTLDKLTTKKADVLIGEGE